MRRAYLTTVLTALLLVLFSSSNAMAKQQLDAAADTPGIKQTVANYIDGFNHHDPLLMAKVFADDADRTNTQGVVTHGLPVIEKSYAGLFAGRLKSAHRTATVKSVRLLTPTIALVDADWDMSGVKNPAGADVPPTKGILALVMTKRDGKWWVTNFHEAEFPE